MRFIINLFSIIWVFIFIEGLLPQIQMAILGGRVIIPSVILKIILIGISLIVLFSVGRIWLPAKVKIPWAFFSVYLIIHLLLMKGINNFTLSYILFGYNVYYFFLLIIPAVFILNNYTNLKHETKMVNLLLFLFIPIGLMGIFQYLMNNPILPTLSVDSNFEVQVWDFFGQVRAFSFFVSGVHFGHYIALISALSLSKIIFGKKKNIWATTIFFLSIIAGYSTLTRTVYIEIIVTIITIVCFKTLKTRGKKVIYLLPLIYAGIGILIIATSTLLSTKVTGDLTSTDSLSVRLDSWESYFEIWFKKSLFNALFGIGFIQNGKIEENVNIIIDNTFLVVGGHIGLIGLVLVIVLTWSLWKYMCNLALKEQRPLVIAIAAMYSSWLITGIFNINIQYYLLVFLLISLVYKSKPGKFLGGVKSNNKI